MKTSKTSSGLKKLFAAMTTAALASAMFAMPAFAEAPGVGDSEEATGEKTAESNTTFYLIDTASQSDTISVTAPTAIYLAVDTSGVSADAPWATFSVPSADAVEFVNQSAKAVKVESWSVANTQNGVLNTAKAGTTGDDEKFYLTATERDQQTMFNIAVAQTATETGTNAWTMGKFASADATINLKLAGEIYKPTTGKYDNNTQIQKVTWKFALADE